MNDQLKTNIVSISRLMWDKELVTGLNGNISVRLDAESFLMTTPRCCLGLIQEGDVLLYKISEAGAGPGLGGQSYYHARFYESHPDVTAVIHTHTAYANAYFRVHERFVPATAEARRELGEISVAVPSLDLETDAIALVELLRHNHIVPVRDHGIFAAGQNLFDCFLALQALEEQIKVDAISRLYQGSFEGVNG